MKTSKTTILEKVSTGVDLTPSEVSYLQSVLADIAEPITEVTELNLEFDHEASDFYSACGIPSTIVSEKKLHIDTTAMHFAFQQMASGEQKITASKLAEAILENADYDMVRFLCVSAIYEKFNK
jgi:hypothetical protein